MKKATFLVVGLLLLVACGPLGPIPGGRLSGQLGPATVDGWGFASGEQTAQLETRPAEPHSVNTWFIGIDTELYVPTSMILGPKQPTERSWVAHVAEDPSVRIRIGDVVYERVAKRLGGGAEYDRARSALEAKYELDPTERDPERDVWIYRLDSR